MHPVFAGTAPTENVFLSLDLGAEHGGEKPGLAAQISGKRSATA